MKIWNMNCNIGIYNMSNMLLTVLLTLLIYPTYIKGLDLCTLANVTGGANLDDVLITHTNLDTNVNVECSMVLYEGPAVTGEVIIKIDYNKFKCSTADAQSLNIYKDGCLENAIMCTTSGDINPTFAIYPLNPDEELYIEYASEINQRTSELELKVSYLDDPDGASDGTIFLGLPIDYQTTKTEAECTPTTTTTTTTTKPPTPPPTVGTTAATVDPGVTPAETEAPTEDPNNPDLQTTSTATRTSTTTKAGGGDSGSDDNNLILGVSQPVFIGIMAAAGLLVLVILILVCAICCTRAGRSKTPKDGMAQPIQLQEAYPSYSYAKEIPRTSAPNGGVVVVHSNGTLGGSGNTQWQESGPTFFQPNPTFVAEELYSRPNKRQQQIEVIEVPANSFEVVQPVQQAPSEAVYVASSGLPRSDSTYAYRNQLDNQFAFLEQDAYAGRF